MNTTYHEVMARRAAEVAGARQPGDRLTGGTPAGKACPTGASPVTHDGVCRRLGTTCAPSNLRTRAYR